MALRQDFISLAARYMLRILFFTLVLFIAHPSFSDTGRWAATYGGYNIDWAESIQQTSDGGYVVGGYYKSYSVSSPFVEGWGNWVLKLGPNGTVEWQKAFGGVGVESVQQTNDGGYVATGARWYFGDEGEVIDLLWVLKLGHDGTVEWQATYGGVKSGRSNSIKQTLDGGYIVTGWTDSFGAGDEDIWVLKLRADASVEWQKTYGGVNKDEAKSIQQTDDGGYIVAGWTRSFGAGESDFWVLKLAFDGTVEWQKTYGGNDFESAGSIQQTKERGYIVAGGTSSSGAGESDFWVLKLSADGTVEWQKTYGGDRYDKAHSIQQTGDGGYIAAGVTRSFGAGDENLWVLKLEPDGTVEWQKSYGGAEWDAAESVQQTGDGGYVVAGKTASFNRYSKTIDLWVLKLSPDGSICPSCNFVMDTSASGTDSNATILQTNATVRDSNARLLALPIQVMIPDVSANILCP
ncbi:MAG: hypothetical protein A3C38_07825 [Planctomycetes bacterium RIFCSPHIGHO2_02_FULL_50_42]|nr:MAG: hypothetical protein A3C38_07825 [Planctomycetes bacterium RIFCSPHIGHO2_02_FULL_50_42]